MTDPLSSLTKFVPGFDFLQGLVRNAGAALPGVGQWVAPSLDPEELEKRIQELRTVQFWLEQNARALGATIQALEVQRMTLSTLKTMNVSLGDLTESLKIKLPDPPAPTPAAASPAPEPAAAPAPSPRARKKPEAAAPDAGAQVPPGVVDPMQWWGALTKQFTEIAANTLKDSAADAAKSMASAMVKQGVDAASDTLKKAAAMPMQMAQTAAAAAGKAAGTAAGMAEAAGKKATRRPSAPRKRAAR